MLTSKFKFASSPARYFDYKAYCKMSHGIDYTLVICTYNPDERILKRCLQAVQNLDRTGITTETILVDNNSNIPVAGLNFVQQYLKTIPAMKTLRIIQQGVQFARMAAIEEAKGKYIVYIDFDNEPQSDYLQVLKNLKKNYNNVAAWGPGNIWVDFIDGIDAGIEEYARIFFQEKHYSNIEYADSIEWQHCYPFGTGLCTNANILKQYAELAKKGMFTFRGRTLKQLSSGEDLQMVLLCIKHGFAAGVAPALKLTHIIPKERANAAYLSRLIYGGYICYDSCALQIFPQKESLLKSKMMGHLKFIRKSVKRYLKAKWSSDPNKKFEAVKFIALQASVYMALQKPLPFIVQRLIKKLNIE